MSSRHSMDCQFKHVDPADRRERGVLLVVAITFVMMVVEITVGYLGRSMALLADGWHMATHVGALGITAAAYAMARRFAQHKAFTFGTGKVQALAGFTSAILLGVVAVSMLVESVTRLTEAKSIDFDRSIPVAILGLFVNLVSVGLLHSREERAAVVGAEHALVDGQRAASTLTCTPGTGKTEDPPPGCHDHAHRAALLHVLADAFTSALAIAALLLARQFGLTWLDPTTGIVGSLVIMKWSVDLVRLAGSELLDAGAGQESEQRIRCALEQLGGVTILDLHVWPMGQGRLSCIITLESDSPRPVAVYRAQILDAVYLSHLTVELRTHER